MTFLVSDVVAEVRFLIQDEGTNGSVRYDDSRYVRAVNQTLKRMIMIRPDIFSYTTTINAVAGVIQSIPTDGMRLIDVLGDGVTSFQAKEINQDALDTMVPTWVTGTAGGIQNWMRVVRDPTKFYCSPPSNGTTQIQISYARTPAALALTDLVPLQDTYEATVIDGAVWIMESIDAEHVESGRAKMYQDSFMGQLTASLTSRKITDTPGAGEPPGDVL